MTEELLQKKKKEVDVSVWYLPPSSYIINLRKVWRVQTVNDKLTI